MKYEVLTSYGVYDITEENHEEAQESLVIEQRETLEKLGFADDCYTTYVVKFGGCREREIMTIDEAIQSLALKDGADLVRFESGNVGFVGYYNGFSIDKNHFQILRLPTNEDIEKWEDGESIEE